MENASKALLIAGGVLIGLITISIFYYMFSHISSFADETSVDYKAKEIIAFNQGFEAYNKKIMYGSDVISVINKAIDNNTRNAVSAGDDSGYSVDVCIKFKTNLETTKDTYERKSYGYEKTKSEIVGKETFTTKSDGYTLKDNKDMIKNILIDVSNWTNEEGVVIENGQAAKYEETTKGYTLTFYPAAEFKRRAFKCTKTEYSDKTGRLSRMTFEQI